MQYKIRMLVSDGQLKATETYWAEEFPSNPNWMFAKNLRVPKYRVNEMFEYVGFRYFIPGIKRTIFLIETNKGYEVNVGGLKPFLLYDNSHKTIFLPKEHLYLTLRYEGREVTHDLYEGITQEYA